MGISNGRIPWPIGKRRGSSSRSLVVFGRLADAVRKESNQAVCYWWSITPQTVTKWRKALDVGPVTEGTSKLRSGYVHEDPAVEGLKKAESKAQDPVRCEKIAASLRGKRRPKHVVDAMRKGRIGKPQSEDARKKMSEAHLRRGAPPLKAGRPWTEEEDQLVRELPAAEVAQRTGRTLSAVYTRRNDLALPDARRRGSPEAGTVSGSSKPINVRDEIVS